ncbi:MAG: antibiotic biosynthesis monooxygenase [Cyanobacteria bacterium J06635_1]
MSEFSDFLKHKQAYVAIGEFKPGRFSEARQLYEKAVSAYKNSCGFKGAYLLQEPGTDCGIAVILWDNIGDMDDCQDADYKAALKEISSLFVKPPQIKFYEVCSEIGLVGMMQAMSGAAA